MGEEDGRKRTGEWRNRGEESLEEQSRIKTDIKKKMWKFKSGGLCGGCAGEAAAAWRRRRRPDNNKRSAGQEAGAASNTLA